MRMRSWELACFICSPLLQLYPSKGGRGPNALLPSFIKLGTLLEHLFDRPGNINNATEYAESVTRCFGWLPQQWLTRNVAGQWQVQISVAKRMSWPLQRDTYELKLYSGEFWTVHKWMLNSYPLNSRLISKYLPNRFTWMYNKHLELNIFKLNFSFLPQTCSS